MAEAKKLFPNDGTTAQQMLRLAQEYRQAAQLLMSLGDEVKSLPRAPYRFLVAHAIELYLNAFLLGTGNTPKTIRALNQDLSARAERAITKGLKLKKRTALHLSAMTAEREHVATRYSPELPPTLSQINRINATLEELAEKITTMVEKT